MKFRDGISIIVTVYNKEQFISKTLETISKQMSGNSQLIIINDGSTDKSELVIKKFIKSQNKDIKYIKQKNAGPSKAVNSAFKFVKYTYLKFVDGDDIIEDIEANLDISSSESELSEDEAFDNDGSVDENFYSTKRKSNERVLVKAKTRKKIKRNVDGENPINRTLETFSHLPVNRIIKNVSTQKATGTKMISKIIKHLLE